MAASVQIDGSAVLIAGGLVFGVWALWKAKQAAPGALAAVGDAVGNAAQAVNPLNRDNVFYTGVNNAGASISGDDHWTLGGWVHEAFNDTSWITRTPTAPRTFQGGGATGSW